MLGYAKTNVLQFAEFVKTDYECCFAINTFYGGFCEAVENNKHTNLDTSDRLALRVGEYFFKNDSITVGLYSSFEISNPNPVSQVTFKPT